MQISLMTIDIKILNLTLAYKRIKNTMIKCDLSQECKVGFNIPILINSIIVLIE